MPDDQLAVQLDIFGNEIPVEDLPEPQPPEPGDAQIQTDDEWPEDFF